MIVLFSRDSLLSYKQNLNKPLAFVPTMGALHDGHLSLVEKAQNDGFDVVVSLFINPKQFNNPEDLLKYPKTIPQDLELLERIKTQAVFIPDYQTIYQNNQINEIFLDSEIQHKFEGHFRPGHFNGVISVLYEFFSLIKPQAVYFGQKDLQQCSVAHLLIQKYFSTIEFHRVETKRERNGLAMSSRNMRLSAPAKETASVIFSQLKQISNQMTLNSLNIARSTILEAGIEIEYLDIINIDTFESWNQNRTENQAVIFAGYLEGIRLIDNLIVS
jgi:pantoate--beta-alanine ligase